MTTFDKQERAYESKFAHDAEQEFKVNARRTKLFGLWVAEKLNMPPVDAQAYAKALVMTDFGKAGSQDVLDKAKADLQARNVAISEKEMEHIFHNLFDVARTELENEVKSA